MASLLQTKRVVWALAFALATAVMAYATIAGNRYVEAVRAVEQTLEVGKAIDEVIAALLNAETGQRGYLLTGDDEFLEPYRSGEQALPGRLTHLRALTARNPVQHRRIARLESLVSAKHAFIKDTIERRRRGQESEVLALVRGGRGKILMDEVRGVGDAMRAEERRTLKFRSERAARSQKHTMFAVGFGSAITLLFLLASVVSVHRDAAEVRRAAEQLADSEERFRLLAEHASDLVSLLGPDGTHLYVSPSIQPLLGYSLEEVNNRAVTALLHPEDVPALEKLIAALRDQGLTLGTLQQRLRHKDGSYRWFESVVTQARTPDGELQLQMTSRDVSDRVRAAEQLAAHAQELQRLSLRDALTGLYNRRGVLELGEQLLRLAERSQRPFSLIFIDLDGLKTINDRLGHEIGDQAIREAGELLQATCRSSDVLGRIGGDEFILLGVDLDPACFDLVRMRIDRALEQRNAEASRKYALSFSLGVAFFDRENPESLESLLARADAAMYSSKRARKAARTSA